MPRIQPLPHGPWAVQDYTLKGPWGFRTKEKVICVCEGGRACFREDPCKQKTPNAIPGIHGNWVGSQLNVLAMARPWQQNISKYQLIEAFQKHKIGMILNLEEVGEHSSCGPGNIPSCGFTYNPETFMAARIGVYNFSWRDMGVPDLNKMMDIVQVMEYVTKVEGRKIAVHCHAGLGRTGLAIACHLVYSEHATAAEAVTAVRRDRPGALQTTQQEMFVYVFEQYVEHLRCLFSDQSRCSAATAMQSTPMSAGLPTGPANEQQNQEAADIAAMQQQQPGQKQAPSSQTFPFGLVIVHSAYEPTQRLPHTAESSVLVSQGSAVSTAQCSGGSSSSNTVVHGDQELPWTADFSIKPDKYNRSWVSSPPQSYQEALQRQQRLLHGYMRRLFLHLHRGQSELVLALINHARNSVDGATTGTSGSSVTTQRMASPARPKQRSTDANSVLTAGPIGEGIEHGRRWRIGRANVRVSPIREEPELLPIHVQMCSMSAIQQPLGESVEQPGLIADPGSQVAGFQPSCSGFAGQLINSITMTSHTSMEESKQLQAALNSGDYACLKSASLDSLVQTLQTLMRQLTTHTPVLSKQALQAIRDSYHSLEYTTQTGPETPQFAAAKSVLRHFPPADQELLLLYSALLRHTIRASVGAGCEEAILKLCNWVLGLLLGPQYESLPCNAHEALTSFLWYLLQNDIAYATLILNRQQRLLGEGSITRSHGHPSKPAADTHTELLAGLPEMTHRMETVSVTSMDEPASGFQGHTLPQALTLQSSAFASTSHMKETQQQQQQPQPMILPGQSSETEGTDVSAQVDTNAAKQNLAASLKPSQQQALSASLNPGPRTLTNAQSIPDKMYSSERVDVPPRLAATVGGPLTSEQQLLTQQPPTAMPNQPAEAAIHDVWA